MNAYPRLLACLLASLAGAITCAWAQGEPFSREAAVKLAQASFPEYLELLSLPSDAVVAADIQKNADWLERAFRKRGFEVRQLANAGKPMLFAEWPKKVAGAKTVLFTAARPASRSPCTVRRHLCTAVTMGTTRPIPPSAWDACSLR